MNKQFRQGDVLVERVKVDITKQTKKKIVPRDSGRIVLAYGEVTGHAHAIAEPCAQMFELESGERFLVSSGGISLRHEEHETIDLPAGTYRVTRQREYHPEELRNVAD